MILHFEDNAAISNQKDAALQSLSTVIIFTCVTLFFNFYRIFIPLLLIPNSFINFNVISTYGAETKEPSICNSIPFSKVGAINKSDVINCELILPLI